MTRCNVRTHKIATFVVTAAMATTVAHTAAPGRGAERGEAETAPVGDG
jgi:hypothetical protein